MASKSIYSTKDAIAAVVRNNPNALIVDFFAGSGTVGCVCVAEGRHCLMCDSDKATMDYFKRHLEVVRVVWQSPDYEPIDDVETFFTKLKGV